MIKRSALESKGYRDFVSDRNKVLEVLLRKSLLRCSDKLRATLTRVLEITSHVYPQITNNFYFTNPAQGAFKQLENSLEQVFHYLALEITNEQMNMRRKVYLLAHVGEVEALSRLTGKRYRTHIHRTHLDQIASKPNMRGEVLFNRMYLAVNRIKRDIIDALELSRTMEESIDAALERVKQSLPKPRLVKVSRRILKEAMTPDDEEDPLTHSDLFIDESEWDNMVNDYTYEFIPEWRNPLKTGGEKITEEEFNGLYPWEVEQELTQDFVDQVRSGEYDGAKASGVSNFVHIAVVDDRTDSCCLWRDGLTITEIEAKLDEHDDDCEGTTPPLHFNCRCRLAPFSEDMPQVPESNIGDFNTWLLSDG